jgi:hypothetical protein
MAPCHPGPVIRKSPARYSCCACRRKRSRCRPMDRSTARCSIGRSSQARATPAALWIGRASRGQARQAMPARKGVFNREASSLIQVESNRYGFLLDLVEPIVIIRIKFIDVWHACQFAVRRNEHIHRALTRIGDPDFLNKTGIGLTCQNQQVILLPVYIYVKVVDPIRGFLAYGGIDPHKPVQVDA